MSSDGTIQNDLAAATVDRVVVAAGGIVLRPARDGLRVLVVHRPAYDDWSLPKGHLDAGEGPEGAAVREVEEETGILARIVAPAGTTEHAVTLAEGSATKRVHWFLMRPAGPTDATDLDDLSARPADDEVDTAAWWPVATALTALTHAGERELLRRATDATPASDAFR
jgi:8-oxo-(d)GTP phosphatase